MKKIKNIINFFFFILLLFPVHTKGSLDSAVYPGVEFYEQLNREIPLLMAKYKIPGVILTVIKNAEVTFSNAYGYANLTTGRKISTDDYCRVESISKSLTAWGIMKLVEQGKVNLDTPVIEYIKTWDFPKSEFSTNKITVRQLLNHTSGLPLGTIGVRYSPTEQRPTLKESLTQNALPNHNPGLRFEYSNVGYHLLELLIEEVTDMSFVRYMEQELLLPLGMTNSSFEWRSTFSGNIPNGYDFRGNPIPPYVYPEKAAGGLFATAGDIAKFVCAGMMNSKYIGKVLKLESILQLYSASVNKLGLYSIVFNSYGFGYFIEELPDGKIAVSHGGQGTGWMSHFHSVPETGDGIVILTNSQRSWPFFAQVLTSWAQWAGFKRIGMSVITISERFLWIVLAIIIIIVIWQILKVIVGILHSTRSLSIFSNKNIRCRTAMMIAFVLILAIYIWAVSQDYFFFTSIFPGIASWLLFVTPAMEIMLLLVVLFPKSGE